MESAGTEAPAMEDPLELTHVIGYSGAPRSLLSRPGGGNTAALYVGSVVVLADLDDPHNQELLRGHNSLISALAISQSGNYLASGQQAVLGKKDTVAPVLVWDIESKSEYLPLYGMKESAVCMAFSPDDRFLAACSSDGLLCVWDLEPAVLIASLKRMATWVAGQPV